MDEKSKVLFLKTVRDIKRMGYDEANVIELLNSIVEEEKQLIINLFNCNSDTNYQKIFELNPCCLSHQTLDILTKYVIYLVEYGYIQRLQELINGLLANNCLTKNYLRKLHNITKSLLEKEYNISESIDISDVMKNKNRMLADIINLSATLYGLIGVLDNEAKIPSYLILNGFGIKNLTYEDNNFEFDVYFKVIINNINLQSSNNCYTYINLDDNPSTTTHIDLNIYSDSNKVSHLKFLEKIEELNETSDII